MAEPRFDTISFLSDYGRVDEFVGVVHSVIRTLAPRVRVVDVTHDVPPHDVRAGGLTLARSVQYLAPGVVLAVVDPAVGTERRGVAVEVGDGAAVLVGPDNGLLAPAVAMVGGAGRVVELTSPDHRLATPGAADDGRDVFAPAAAHLCNGVDLAELGREVDPAGLRPGVLPLPQLEDDGLGAEVLWVDRFGNAQLNLGPDDLDGLGGGDRVGVRVDERTRSARRVRAFADLVGGELGLVVDSYGLVALVLDQRSAAEELGVGASDAVTLVPLDEGDGREGGATSPVTLRPKG
ncbi:SAM-dependent chlorinase/fluorinase [Iamia majanohamensis]|uniref:SAM-dependent chlorinase/fluorinase n=1 Tax=Iamia majanohamensis TaxID=467976 RepID=A0AAF0BTG3_9ACTN|nr:SAM-dependent chlorinase/fluorinase [Iamia majanohamensis]WCO66757.1 SAM-dependent chlorinase/fluorinase [Iamia majanohamensis]